MNSSWLFRTHRGQARLRSKANTFHIHVYREKGEAVMKTRPCWTQTRRSRAGRSADEGPDCGPRSTGPWPRWAPSTSFIKQGLSTPWPCRFPSTQAGASGGQWLVFHRILPAVCHSISNLCLVPNRRLLALALLVWSLLEKADAALKDRGRIDKATCFT